MDLHSIETKNLDHLGLVAAIAKDLGIIEKINVRLDPDQTSIKVSMGQRALALILNGLGFTDERLYMVSQFFQTKPVERLIGEGVKSEYLNDDSLGRLLDAIYAYGTTKLYSEIAFEIAQENNLLGKNAHLDTTNFSLQGEYENDEQNEKAIQINHGYSKSKRFDLKQITLSLTTTGKSAFPIWMEALDGNESDKRSFHETIEKVKKFTDQLKNASDFVWVADSALYTIDKLSAVEGLKWITRVPETIKKARELSSLSDDKIPWHNLSDGYRIHEISTDYGNMPQRWLLVYSEQAYQREKKTFEKKIETEAIKLKNDAWHLGNEIFQCEKDALKSAKEFAKQYNYHDILSTVEIIEKYTGRGRPKAESPKTKVGYGIKIKFDKNQKIITEQLATKGRFILATSQLDQNAISTEDILYEYKSQSQVERGFRFLKDPWFMVDSVFLKKNERVEALMLIMTLCLMVYNVGEYRLREQLKEKKETLPNQLKKQISNPTLRWIFKMLQGISMVRICVDSIANKYQTHISNISVLTKRIIGYFGKKAETIYGILPICIN